MRFSAQRAGSNIPFSEDFFYLTLLGVIAAMAGVAAAVLVIILNRNFLTIACDTEVLENAIVNTMHGHWFASNGSSGPSILASHTTFMLLAVLPFFVVAPFPETLFAFQCLGVFSTLFPLYLLARDFGLQPRLAYILAASSLLSAFLVHMAMAPFHLETWIAAAALWSYHFYLRRNLTGFLISLLVALCCGEQAALIFIALGISLLLVKDDCSWRRQFGVISLLCGVLWLALAVLVIIPWANSGSSFNIYAYNYTQWGIKSAAGLPGAVVANPTMALKYFFSPDRWIHLFTVMGFLLVTAFCSWRSLLLLLPLPAYLLMSDQEFFLYFHAYYYSFIFFSGYIGLFHLLRRFDPLSQTVLVGLSVFWLAAVLMLCNAVGFYFQLVPAVDEPFSTVLRQQFARIPPDATVYGPHRYSVYLGNRLNFVMGDMPAEGVDFDSMVDGEFDRFNVHSDQIDFIVSDFYTDQCGWRRGFFNTVEAQRREDAVKSLVASGKWEVAWQQNSVIILQRIR